MEMQALHTDGGVLEYVAFSALELGPPVSTAQLQQWMQAAAGCAGGGLRIGNTVGPTQLGLAYRGAGVSAGGLLHAAHMRFWCGGGSLCASTHTV